jgi:peptide/nickel transport system substrate-binding protein
MSLAIRSVLVLALLAGAWVTPGWAQQPKAGKAAAAVKATPAPNPNGKHGGILRVVLRENWPSLSPHEEGTISTVWPVAPMYNNLVVYDPFRQAEDGDHIVGDLADSWAWSDAGKKLTFKLRRGVKWHDGQPFTSKDVKHTWDVAREAPEAAGKRFRLNPRKLWWENIRDITVNGDYEVSFLLKNPQPSLLSFLANGYTPVYPAHVIPQDLRAKSVGTGPFKLKEAKPDEQLVLEKNPDYFVKGRPYLDGIVYSVIRAHPSRMAALQAGQVDVYFPGETSAATRDQLKLGNANLVFHAVAQGVTDNILLNHTKPPFNNPKLRRAVDLAMDRAEMIKVIHRGAAIPGAANLPAPYGKWGLGQKDLVKLPGYGDPEANKAEAKKILAELGYGPSNPLKVVVSTRAIDIYINTAVWVIDQLGKVGIEGKLEQFETGVWHPKATRREFEIGTNLTGVAVDDPDGNFFENYTCTSSRNYPGYCNKDVEALMQKASVELNAKKRLDLVHQIDRQLQMDGARPILAHRMDFFVHWPYVKNLVPHHNIYNWGRMQEVWLDK